MTTKWSGSLRLPILAFTAAVFLLVLFGSLNSSASSLKIINSAGRPIGLVFDGLKPQRHASSGVTSATLQSELPRFQVASNSETTSDRGRRQYEFKRVQSGCDDCTGHYMEQVVRFCTISCNYTWTQETGDVFELGYEVCAPNVGCTCYNEYTCINNGIH